MLNHVRQKNQFDCGLAMAACLARKTLDQAIDADPDPKAKRGLSLTDLRTILATLTEEPWSASKPTPVPLTEFTSDHDCGLLIRERGAKWGHYVAWSGGMVLDSDRDGPMSPAEHPYADWLVIRVIARRVRSCRASDPKTRKQPRNRLETSPCS